MEKTSQRMQTKKIFQREVVRVMTVSLPRRTRNTSIVVCLPVCLASMQIQMVAQQLKTVDMPTKDMRVKVQPSSLDEQTSSYQPSTKMEIPTITRLPRDHDI